MGGPALLGLLLIPACGGGSGDGPDADAGQEQDAATDGPGAPTDSSAPPDDAGPGPEDAGPPEPCDSPGEMRVVECGRCGMASERCTDGFWERISACVDEGECFAGEVEEDTSMCGMRTRICTEECTWTDWTVMEPAGECEPGDMETSAEGCETGEARSRMCTEECTWHDGPCEATCLDPPAASRTGADPVCIPAGDFILGHEAYSDAKPVMTITMSEYHVARFPVTKEAYDMCIDAGACTVSDDPELYDSLEPDFYATGVTIEEAIAFCEWDGGALITEYQWEKVARGPAPSARLHPWGDDPGGCEYHPWEGCTERPFAITKFPDAVSPYGVRQFGSSYELTQSRHTPSYRNISTTDPTGEMHLLYNPDGPFTRRGYHWYSAEMTTTRESSASWRYSFPAYIPAFRCVY